MEYRILEGGKVNKELRLFLLLDYVAWWNK